MKILLVAPIHKEKDYLDQKGNNHFLIGQAQQSWVDALENLGHKVGIFRYSDSVIVPNKIRINISAFFQKITPLFYSRFRRFNDNYYFLSPESHFKNRKLLNLALKSKPDLIIISGGAWCLFPKVIEKIKNSLGIKVLLFSGVDPNIGSPKAERKLTKEVIDLIVVNDNGFAKEWEKFGSKKTLVLPVSAVDPKFHRRIKLSKEEKKEYSCDVCFVGSLTGDRQVLLSKLLNFNIKIWGDLPPGVNLRSELKEKYQGKATGEKMIKIYSGAKIVLNIYREGMRVGGNMRAYEIFGSGAFQLTNREEPGFKNNSEFVAFTDYKDLQNKINYYLLNRKERVEIAQNGFRQAHGMQTYEKHFEKLFSKI